MYRYMNSANGERYERPRPRQFGMPLSAPPVPARIMQPADGMLVISLRQWLTQALVRLRRAA
jgi:hypothetical protein